MKKKGFTLIELLAVIVILAIIALIATPIVLNMINNARKSAAKASALGFIEAVDNNNGFADIGTEGFLKISDGEIEVEDIDVKMKGKKPSSGTVIITKGRVTEASLCINEYTVTYDGKEAIINGKCDSKPRYKEELLNGADPVLRNELIPVIIENDGTVKYADTSKKWYEYGNNKWANAVVLFDGETANVGDVIPESKIREYFVWIPRYKYKLWNAKFNKNSSANVAQVEKPIEIVFESSTTTPSNGTADGDYLTHPAFTNFDTNGIWFGKYEISYNEESFTNSNTFLTKNPNTDAATDGKNIIIKPNVRSLSNKNVSQFYVLSRAANTTLNSHMITNVEWGAAAYLTYSIYGRCDSTSCNEVLTNSVTTGYYTGSRKFSGQLDYGTTITGCSANPERIVRESNVASCSNPFNSTNGYLASTTGNVSGIYDMAGGDEEFVMGVLTDSNGSPYSGYSEGNNSGFNGIYSVSTGGTKADGIDFPTDSRYYNLYLNSALHGDATKELIYPNGYAVDGKMWFQDLHNYITSTQPWFLRGGNWNSSVSSVTNGYTTSAGVLAYYPSYGSQAAYNSSRIVLAY